MNIQVLLKNYSLFSWYESPVFSSLFYLPSTGSNSQRLFQFFPVLIAGIVCVSFWSSLLGLVQNPFFYVLFSTHFSMSFSPFFFFIYIDRYICLCVCVVLCIIVILSYLQSTQYDRKIRCLFHYYSNNHKRSI